MLFRYTRPAEQTAMPTAKFCSECGATLPAVRRLTHAWAHCATCAPRFRTRRALTLTILLLLVVFAFGSGRYLAPQRTVYLIGTPIEPLAAAEPDARANARASSSTHEARAASSTDEVVTICGAPTKSGKPCQRKVKGGGYCYQHRDRYGQKNSGAPAQ
jgi:hypothetical protein